MGAMSLLNVGTGCAETTTAMNKSISAALISRAGDVVIL
jgi:hypothetical protein